MSPVNKKLYPEKIDFIKIREMCESNDNSQGIDLGPSALRAHRIEFWPSINKQEMGTEMCTIYEAVRETGMPNAVGAQRLLPSNLNISNWEAWLSKSPEDIELLGFLKYGFPLGYLGPISDSQDTPNHPSAVNYKGSVDDFISKEVGLGGIVGPFKQPAFREWTHISPLMTREKKDSAERRVIIDMTYPHPKSVNAYLYKNSSLGVVRDHTLPSVDDVVKALIEMGPGARMATTDISRAYKNFLSCPLDWPLLSFRWKEKFYCDITMPFGARSSSCHMQRVAVAITDMLARRGVWSKVYLDDLIIISPTAEKAQADFTVVQQLLSDLGLPEAIDKRQGPSQIVTWLGVEIDAVNMSLAIPEKKLMEIQVCVGKALRCRTMSKKHLQSLLGKLLYIAKCIRPARLFVSRLLERLRGMEKKFTRVTREMRRDLEWFQEFASNWNGIAIIPSPIPNKTIVVDACGSGIGAYDERGAYAGNITPLTDPVNNITELEAVNLVTAVYTFVSNADRGSHILVKSDSLSSVQVFQSGRGRNKVLLDCARHLWMCQALLDIRISYAHITGQDNIIADSLSRMHISRVYREIADEFVTSNYMSYVMPNLYVFNAINPCLHSRTGARVTPGSGNAEAARGPCSRHPQKPHK